LKLPPTTKTVLENDDADPKKGRKAAEKALTDAGLPITDENVFIASCCEDKGILFLQDPKKVPIGVRKVSKVGLGVPAEPASRGRDAPPAGYTVTVNGAAYGVELKGDKAIVNGKEYAVSVAEGLGGTSRPRDVDSTSGKETEVKASVPGAVLRIVVSEGMAVNEGDELLVMDVMKMETPIKAPCAGTVKSIQVAQTDKVNTGDVLAVIG
jgi:pyruvate carboxylase subunit B